MRNRFLDNDTINPVSDPVLSEEALDRLFELQSILEAGGFQNTMLAMESADALGVSYTEEGIMGSIWNGIKAFFKAIGDFFLKLFGMETKEASSDGLTAKQKQMLDKFMKSKITVKPSEICFANRDKLTEEIKAAARSGKAQIYDIEIPGILSVLTPEFDEKYPKRIQALQELGLLPGGKVSWELHKAFPADALDMLQTRIEFGAGLEHMESSDSAKPLTIKTVYRSDIFEFLEFMYSATGQAMPINAVELNSSLVKDALNTKLASIRSIDFAFPNPVDLEKWLENFQDYRHNLLKGGVKQKLEHLRNIKEPNMKTTSPEQTKALMTQLKELGKCMRLYLDLQIKTLSVIKQGKETMLQYYGIVALINTIRE